MSDGNRLFEHLIVNRVQLVHGGCSACGQNLAFEPPGGRALTVSLQSDTEPYIFCASCGDSIMLHLKSDEFRSRYGWDWVVPLRGRPVRIDGSPELHSS